MRERECFEHRQGEKQNSNFKSEEKGVSKRKHDDMGSARRVNEAWDRVVGRMSRTKIRMSRERTRRKLIGMEFDISEKKLSLMCFSDLREEFMRNISFLLLLLSHPSRNLARWHTNSFEHFRIKARSRVFLLNSSAYFSFSSFRFTFFFSCRSVSSMIWVREGGRRRAGNKRTANVKRLWTTSDKLWIDYKMKEKRRKKAGRKKWTSHTSRRNGMAGNLFGSRMISLSIRQEFN